LNNYEVVRIKIRAPPNYYVDNVSVVSLYAYYQNDQIYIYFDGNDAIINLGWSQDYKTYYPLKISFNLYLGDLPERNTYDASRDPYSNPPSSSGGSGGSSGGTNGVSGSPLEINSSIWNWLGNPLSEFDPLSVMVVLGIIVLVLALAFVVLRIYAIGFLAPVLIVLGFVGLIPLWTSFLAVVLLFIFASLLWLKGGGNG